MRRVVRAALVCAFAGFAGAAPAQQPKIEQPKTGGTLIFATGTDVQTLDPQFVTDVPTARIVANIHETLVRADENGEIKPCLALSWATSDDRLTWTFRLRQGVRFHDGTPFNAAAVKATFDRLRDAATGSPRRSALAAIADVRIIDDFTIALVTAEPFAPLLAQLSAYNLAIMSPAQLQQAGVKYREQPAGTGPFRLKSWQPGERITLVRNDDYWGDKPKLDAVETRVVPEDSARVLQLLSGEADVIASVPTVMLKRLEGSSAVQVIRKTGFRTIYVGLNNAIAPFNDRRVREAVAHAIDVTGLQRGVLSGVGELGGGFESPVIGGAKAFPPRAYDPAKAKQLLAQAGLPNGFATSFYVPTGRYLMDRQLGEAIQAQLSDVGIKARIESPEWGALTAIIEQKKAPMFLMGKGSPTGDLDFTLTLTAMSNGRMNAFALSDPELDRLILAQREALEPEQRRALLARAQDLIFEAVPAVVLFYEDQLFATRSNVHGLAVYPNEFVDFSGAWKG
ncbi:MAG TPA: ABC transporter substrate-binding protein [Xanthobacteraceae bacterium]|nr:ABC transporter substrate-binding protein [Xanthobacteraceae bacterium]